jgi:putative nucleotidyltransferase with HDIG domain
MPFRAEIRRVLLNQSRDDAQDSRLEPIARLTAAKAWVEMAMTERIAEVPAAIVGADAALAALGDGHPERTYYAGLIDIARAEYGYFVGDFKACEASALAATRNLERIATCPPRYLAFARRFLGLARSELYGADRGLEEYFAALDDLRRVNENVTPEELVLLAEIGSSYAMLTLTQDAAEVFDEALEQLSGIHDARATFVVNSYAVSAYRDLHRYPDAINCAEAALAIAASTGASRWYAVAAARLATVHLELGSTELAHELLGKALVIAQDIGYSSFIPWIHLRNAKVYAREGKPAEARRHAEAALNFGDSQETVELQRQAYEVLSHAAAALGDTQAEFQYQRALLAIERRLFGSDTRKRLLDFSVRRAAARAQRKTVELEARMVSAQKEMEQAQYETMERLAIAAEARDQETAEHTYRVGHMAAAIAAELGLPAERVEHIRFAARLHDIGKIGIPDHIMLKPGPLSDSEFEIVKTHTLVGARILADGRTELMRVAESVAASHHESWSGGGYPYGLVGEAIPLAGRITAVADVFDALTHARPYKDPWDVVRALDEIRFLSGKKFQPDVVSAFLRVVQRQPDFIDRLMRLRLAS